MNTTTITIAELKTTRRNVELMKLDARKALERHPRIDAKSHTIAQIVNESEDKWSQANSVYLFGVAIGMRLAKAEMKKDKDLHHSCGK